MLSGRRTRDWALRQEKEILFTVYLLALFEFSATACYYLIKNTINTFSKKS